MGALIFSLLYYIFIVVAVALFLLATLIVYPLTVPFDRSRRAVHAISRGISMIFFRSAPGWKTTTEGLENIDRNQRYVIVLNHRSMVDIPMLYWTPLNFRWVARDTLKTMPLIGQYMMLHGDILIPRDKPRKAIQMVRDDGRKWLMERNTCIAIFPEGTRSKTGDIGLFKPTAFTLAQEAKAAILPVVLSGSDVIGRRMRLPWRHRFTVKVLPPVSAAEVAKRDPREIMDETRTRMIAAKKIINNES
ncbi:MAG: 1-acyl-sn-glycerol-3-phosphate acyltransferase [Alistipes sp.]|jgi:1-acyl-sn-glycerol-3-phosphate acyltransferase|nr:1-acyl-sn-glycerol-3-phosphate acyltransferase [Alistipes sp.]